MLKSFVNTASSKLHVLIIFEAYIKQALNNILYNYLQYKRNYENISISV